MNLSKSKYCEAIRCKKLLWLDENHPELKEELGNESVLDNGTMVGEIAKNLLGEHENIKFNNDLNVMINETKEKLKKESVVITEASFLYDNNFCSVDLLKKDKDELSIYEVKSSTELNDIYLDDISYQYYVLNNSKLNIKKCFIVYINSHYIREKKLDINKLFIKKDVTDIVLKKQSEVEKNIKEINLYMKKEEVNDDIGEYCKNPYPCPYFNYCTRLLPDNNIFKIRRMSNKTKFKFYKIGIYKYEDLKEEKINDKYKQQIEFELFDKEDYIDIQRIKEFLRTLSYPLYFLDFETFQQAIPIYEKVHPYEQIPFQYSLHYIENGNLKHKEFLAEADVDPRRSLAERLVQDIPLDVCTVAYNMMFEKMVIRNLANLYPDLSNHLMNIYNHIKDLMVPFKERYYYSKNMYGSFSIKYVLPALFPDDPSLDYHNLEDIHNGSEAMNSYANLSDLEKGQQEKIRHSLLKYCELDTYAMVKIWEKLNEVIKDKK